MGPCKFLPVSRKKVRLPDPTLPRPGRKRAASWPDLAAGVEAAKWQVLIGHRVKAWRLEAGAKGGMVQKQPAAALGVSQATLSRIEAGRIALDAATLRGLATKYGKTLADIGELFRPPEVREWATLLGGRVPDPRFTAPPTTGIARPRRRRAEGDRPA